MALVLFIDSCQSYCQRTVDENGNFGYASLFKKLVEIEKQFLGAFHGESWNHKNAAGLDRLFNDVLQNVLARAGRLVKTITVSRFYQTVVGKIQSFGRL